MKKNQPSQIFGWSMFDFANTSFTVIIVTVVFPVYFSSTICNLERYEFLGFTLKNPADFFWGIGSSIAYLIVALSAPILGAMSDVTSRKKKYIFYYSLLCISATVGIYFLQPGDIFWAIALYIMGNVGFETGIIFYDSFLPVISSEENYSRFSGYGYAAGYLGALFSLLIALYYNGSDVFEQIFIVSGIFFFITSLPFYIFVKEKKQERIANFTEAVGMAISRVKKTISLFHMFPAIKRFVMSYFLYINGVGTIIAFGGLYASNTLGFKIDEVIIFFGIVQLFAMIGSFLFGWIGSKKGDFFALKITLYIWMGVCVGSFFAGHVTYAKELFYFMGVFAGMALGSSQSLSRSYYSRMIPKAHEAEFFGFFAVCGRFAAIIGPLVFGIISTTTGDQSLSVLSVLFFFIIGLILLQKVPALLKVQSEHSSAYV